MLVKQSKCRQGLPKNQEILQTSFKSKRAGNLLRDKIGEKGRSQGIELPKMEEQRWPILEILQLFAILPGLHTGGASIKHCLPRSTKKCDFDLTTSHAYLSCQLMCLNDDFSGETVVVYLERE